MIDSFDKSIGERIRRFRKLRGITQQDLATMLGVSFQQVQKYEQGANKVNFERLYRLSIIFEVPLTAWVDGPQRIEPGWEADHRHALSLLHAFHGIARQEHRILLCALAKALGEPAQEKAS